MGDKIELKLDKREVHGKKVARLRKEGIIPAVVYGPDVEPAAVQADHRLIDKTISAAGYHTPVHLTLAGKKLIAMIKDISISPAKNRVQHVSFHAVRQNEPVNAVIPITLVGEGESEAERAGLVVLQSLEQIEVRALPMDLPEAFEADIRGLKEPGDRLTVGDLTIPKDVTIVESEQSASEENEEGEIHRITDLVIANVYEPSALQAANEAAAGDAEDESEVLGEGDEETEADSEEGDQESSNES